MFLRQILSCYNLKNFFSKLVKVLVLVLELFYGTRTRTRKLSTRLHHCLGDAWSKLMQLKRIADKNNNALKDFP